MTALASEPADFAPKDGRVYRGYFERSGPRGAVFKAVCWDQRRGWIDLEGRELGSTSRLSAWSPD